MTEATPYPLHTLFWETTLRCNARCAFCGSGCGENTCFPDELTTEEISTALHRLAEQQPVKDVMINVTGGEPLLRQDVFEVMTQAVSWGFSWGMVTNGSLITPQVIRRMKESGMKTLTVSLDGCAATHEHLRRLPSGSLDRILAGLRQIAAEGFLDHLQVTTVVNRQNLDELEALRALLLPIGLNSWRVVTADPIGRAKDNAHILLDRAGMSRYFAFMEQYRQDTTLPVLPSCSHYFGAWESRLRTRCFDCGAGTRVMSILYNGDIFVCPNVERRPELIQGNVRTHDLAERWQNGFGFFRQKHRTLSERCRTCDERDSCRGDSLHTWDFDTRTPRFCIRDFYDEQQKAAYSARKQLYDEVAGALPADTSPAAILRIYSDHPTPCRVFLTDKAAEDLYTFFDWGQSTPANSQEQMACLLGRQTDGLLVVEHLQAVELVFADPQCAVFARCSLDSAQEALQHYRQSHPQAELLGFIHSHPHELKTILSEADVDLHRYLTEELSVALSMLVNPQKRRMKAYWGRELSLAEIRIGGTQQTLRRWQIKNTN